MLEVRLPLWPYHGWGARCCSRDVMVLVVLVMQAVRSPLHRGMAWTSPALLCHRSTARRWILN